MYTDEAPASKTYIAAQSKNRLLLLTNIHAFACKHKPLFFIWFTFSGMYTDEAPAYTPSIKAQSRNFLLILTNSYAFSETTNYNL